MTIQEDIETFLALHADEGYRAFQAKLIPNIDPGSIVGVRTPDLRKFAKTLARRDDVDEFLAALPYRTFEEAQLHSFIIAQERDFFRESIQYSINTPFGQTIMPENRKAVLLDTLENYRHVEVNDNLRFIVEVFSKLECEVMNDWFRSDEPTDLARWTDDLVSLVPDRLYRALEIPATDR